jgi:hypothetical protein
MISLVLQDYISDLAEAMLQADNDDFGVEALGILVFDATFNNISVISWLSVLLVEEPREPGKNH